MTTYKKYLNDRTEQSIQYSEYVADCVNKMMDNKTTFTKSNKQNSKTETKSIWSRLRLDSKITIILSIIGLVLSFLTLMAR